MRPPLESEKSSTMKLIREIFHISITTLLTLLLPLSFLLLARVSTANYLFAINEINDDNHTLPNLPSVIFFTLFLKPIPLINPLYLLVSLLGIASLVQTFNNGGLRGSEPVLRPGLHTAWIVLCTMQVWVGLGIEGSIWAGIDGSGSGQGRGWVCRVVFFLGLDCTTVYWWRTVVKAVVDDTMFGGEAAERRWERAAMAAALGGLWWWRLREEVEALVVVAEVKREMGVGVGSGDFMGWWLYYLMVTIGLVRMVKGLIWFGVVLLCRKVQVREDDIVHMSIGVEEKV